MAIAHANGTKHYLEHELETLMQDPETLEFLDQAVLDGIWYWDLENPEHEYLSPAFWHTLGFDEKGREHKAEEWQDLIFPEDRAIALCQVEAHLADPTVPYDQVVRYRKEDGGTAVVRCRGKAIYRDGKPTRLLGAHTLVQDTSATAIQDHLVEIVEFSGDAIISWTEEDGVQSWNRGAETLFGVNRREAIGHQLRVLTRAKYPVSWVEIRRHLDSGQEWEGQVKHAFADAAEERELITRVRITRKKVDKGKTLYLAIFRDDTERTRTARHNELLVRELKHRVLNMFAVMQAIIRMSARTATDIETFSDSLISRMSALAAGHSASLNASPNKILSLGGVLQAVLAPHLSEPGRLTFSGPDVEIGPDDAAPLGLILHEFATNAMKHGAWQRAGGKVAVNWDVKRNDNGDRICSLTWAETPVLSEDSPVAGFADAMTQFVRKEGFGTKLIETSARQLNGRYKRQIERDTFCNSLIFPI